jgi:hypothetical protein
VGRANQRVVIVKLVLPLLASPVIAALRLW